MRPVKRWAVLLSVAVITALALPAAAYADAITAAYGSFSAENMSAFQLNGSAALSGSAIRLTEDVGGQSGSAFWKQRVSLADNRSFSTTFAFKMQSSGVPADGLVFVVQPGTNTALSAGEGMGYGGIPNSLGVEFDTYFNPAAPTFDPNSNHVGIDFDGSTQSSVTANPGFSMATAGDAHAWIDYDGVTKQLEVRVANSATRPAAALITYNVDLADHFGSDVYVGFTAATGGLSESHDIESWYFNNDYIAGSIDPASTTYTMGVATIDVSASPGSVNAGDSSTITLTTKDASGNVLPNVALTLTTDLGTVSPTSVTTNGSGQATVSFSAPTAGTAHVRATSNSGVQGGVDVAVAVAVSSVPASSTWSFALLVAVAFGLLIRERRRLRTA